MSIRPGDRGTTVGELRPSGFIDLNGRRVAATTDVGFVPDGEPVVVVGATAFGVVVRPPAAVGEISGTEPLDPLPPPDEEPRAEWWKAALTVGPGAAVVSAGGWGYHLAGWEGVALGVSIVAVGGAALFGLFWFAAAGSS